ncbi:hypothetical protein K0M31_011222 [Melipona bicolor]|uniref:Uncharacterized protein n=1 Tax=Melipona bicolor TaxID=60889 RepID=A0AA40G9D3_9HYME|nr:hypothetical protein K0M31_011222 [Melipona bicolor]
MALLQTTKDSVSASWCNRRIIKPTYYLRKRVKSLNQQTSQPALRHLTVIADRSGGCRVINANDCDLNFNFRQGNAFADLASGLQVGYRSNRSIIINPTGTDRTLIDSTSALDSPTIGEPCNGDLNFIGNGRCHPPDASREQVPFKFQSSQWAQSEAAEDVI